ncbi:MAG: hypothetical protein AAF531_13200 [Actinomycetota bacterium]
MTDAPLLQLSGLHAEDTGGVTVLDGASLAVEVGETHVIHVLPDQDSDAIGAVVLGSHRYRLTDGAVRLRGEDIGGWPANIRAGAGLFRAAPAPQGRAGISNLSVLRAIAPAGMGDAATDDNVDEAVDGEATGVTAVRRSAIRILDRLGLDQSLLTEDVGTATSPVDALGASLLRVLFQRPEVVLVDLAAFSESPEIFALLTKGVGLARFERPGLGTLIMSRDERLLDHLEPDHIHVLSGGRVTACDRAELASFVTTNDSETRHE